MHAFLDATLLYKLFLQPLQCPVEHGVGLMAECPSRSSCNDERATFSSPIAPIAPMAPIAPIVPIH
ncbi:MAG: hypothetical protein IKN29_01100 [Bacteroidales bacterium]|nr:hypothetical protein [Bacteroidales bacterium]